MKWLRKINTWAEIGADVTFSSIYTMWSFVTLSLIPAALPALMSPILYVSNCIQLVALPALGVSNSVQNAATRKMLEQTRDMLMQEMNDHQKDHVDIDAKIERLTQLVEALSERIK